MLILIIRGSKILFKELAIPFDRYITMSQKIFFISKLYLLRQNGQRKSRINEKCIIV